MRLLSSLFILLLLVLAIQPGTHSSTERKAPTSVVIEGFTPLSGDVVMRDSKGWMSSMFKRTSTGERRFSHAGVVLIEPGGPVVYHMLDDGLRSGLQREPLAKFTGPRFNHGYSVYRFGVMEDNSEKLQLYLKSICKQQPEFDDHFDLSDRKKLYCTELIYDMLERVAGLQLPVTTFRESHYVAPDNLYLNPYCRLIYDKHY
jgi:hypothetical protein